MPLDPRHTAAVVLKVSDYGESDKIVTFYTQSFGKLACIAKGAKRSKKRFVNKLELFSLLQIIFDNKGSSLARIDEAELIRIYPLLREDYTRYAAATLICEILLNWTKEYDEDERLFTLLLWTLNALNSSTETIRTLILFHIKLFDILGYRPDLSVCSICGMPPAGREKIRFSISGSCIICSKCSKHKGSAEIPVSLSTLKLMQKTQDLPLTKLSRLCFSQTSSKEATNIVRQYSSYLLQRDIQSWNFL